MSTVFATTSPQSAIQNLQSNAATATANNSTTSSSSSGSATITSDDFLTLLVAEMKNQDPTQPTDPTQYVQQLVQVNSLEQLIDINKGVSTLDSGSTAA